MDKLIKQFQRDFKKNPKKVFLLGGLFLVCLWVVVPLILPQEEKKPVRRTPIAAVTEPTAAGQTAAAAPTWRWQDLDRALNDDPRMRSTGDEANVAAFPPPRNPFETPFDVDAAMDELLAEAAAETESEQAVAVQTTTTESVPLQTQFDSVPLELSSTIISGERSVAVLNGRPFHEGEKIGTSYGAEVVLKSIAPRSVEVTWNGVTRTLRILSPREAAPQTSLVGIRTTP